MYHDELYPTPLHVLEIMQLDCVGKIVLDPHAGFGNILEYAKTIGAKEIIAIEINERCQSILKDKQIKLIGKDFFNCTAEMISHVDCIYMNPPFSDAHKHILHAWEIAPEGCEIVSLCNWQTIENFNRYGKLSVILKNGITENIGDVFSTAERTTGIDIGLIKLYKPILSEGAEFEGFFMDEDEEEEQGIGIMEFNEVRALVNRYVGTMKAFDLMKEEVENVNRLLSGINMSKIDLQIGYNKSVANKDDFSKTLQKESWKYIFSKMRMDKYVTSGVMKDINKFVETQEKVPFTMKNIYRMFQIIVGTRQNTYNRALEEAIDNFTKHTHENRYKIEGWKTNSGHMLNKKFIVDGMVEEKYNREGLSMRYSSYGSDKMDDLIKVLCNITAKNYDNYGRIYNWNSIKNPEYGKPNQINILPNTWYEWGFFEMKFFKKGTMHIKFKDLNDWYMLNKAYGELKGFSLPEQHKN